MDVKITNSKFSSLSLYKPEEWQTPFGVESCYIQRFAIGEEIRIQFFSGDTGFEARHIDENEAETPLTITELITIGEKTLFETVFTVNTPGLYRFELKNGLAGPTGACFCIQPVEDLEDTVLLSYTHRNNDFNTIFTGRRFNFRIEGGIYPGEKTLSTENEIFRDQRFNLHQTFATTYEVSVLTIGPPAGVPCWAGNKTSHIFDLSDVEVNGIKSVRHENATTESIPVGNKKNSLSVYKISIEQPDEDVHTLVD
ncbi:MAG: hypothetical protein LBG15_12625, partial [Dysgonamonadaceae bacterium]|nr:hypothetical protein [Dysgonamonadaceae bacterium]